MMRNSFNRRDFLKHSARSSALVPLAGFLSADSPSPRPPPLAVVHGESIRSITRAAVEALGGMSRFVPRGARVRLLPNPQGRGPGASTSPELVTEVIRLCLAAGASEVSVCSIHGPGRWRSTGIVEAVRSAGGQMIYPSSERDWIELAVPKGKTLVRATIIREALRENILINLPVLKQHVATRMTGCLKNLMGLNSDNGSLHQGQEYLDQAIADLASLFKPALNIVDAYTILVGGGPFGPGPTRSPKQVLAGVDMVAVDSFCCRFLDLRPLQVGHIRKAEELSLGKIETPQPAVLEVRE